MSFRRRDSIDPEVWLRLFALDFLLVLIPVFIFVLLVTPIRSDIPAFVDFPISSTAIKSPEMEYDVHVTVLRDGRIFLYDELIGTETLSRRLNEVRTSRRRPPTIRVRADRAAPFGPVRRVVHAAGRAGYPRVTFMVEPSAVTLNRIWY